MIELSRISLVQWHLFGREDIDVGGDVAILGRNRSGKSTLIDLVQLVMTGGNGRQYKFNSSAGEAGGGRSERTLQGYCLGQLGEQEPLRVEAVTHVALVFEDFGGARPVSIGLCIEASLRDGAQIVGRYVVPGVRLDTSYFVEDRGDGRVGSAGWSTVRDRLERACERAGTGLLRHDTSRNFVREYMRLLFTGHRMTDPDRFARAFVMALSFEDMRSVETFVTGFLLARDDIDIGELRDSIQRYRDIQRDIHELELRLAALRGLHGMIGRFDDLLEREETARATARLASFVEAGAALLRNVGDRRTVDLQLQDFARELDRIAAEVATLREEEGSLRDQAAAQDAALGRAGLEKELKLLERERTEALGLLRDRFLSLARAVGLLDHRERLAPLRLGTLFEALEAVRIETGALEPPSWPADARRMDELVDGARAAASANLPKVVERRDEAIRWRGNVEQDIRVATEGLAEARRGTVLLEEPTRLLMQALEGEGMRPRALCQATEVVDEGWREAAEAFLGRDREAIIVDPQHASRAVEILRRGRDRYRGCRVANTRRLAEQKRVVVEGTLASVLRSEDPLALAFLVQRAGSVRLAETQEELLSGGRAIMRDGAYNSGIVVEVLRAHGVKIGRAAAPLMIEKFERQITEARAVLATHLDAARFHADVARRLEELADDSGGERRLDELSLSLDRLAESCEAKRIRLQRITASIDPALQTELARVARLLEELQGDQVRISRSQGQLTERRHELDRTLAGGDSLIGSRLRFANRLRLLREQLAGRAALASAAELYRSERPKSLDRVVSDMSRRADEAREEHRALEGGIREALGHYRVTFDNTAPVIAPDRILADLRPWVDGCIAAIEENELIGYRRQADEAADRIGRLFRTAFIHELNNRFNVMRTELATLSRALLARPLHGETYRLEATPKEEFAALHRLAQESEADDGLFEALFGREPPRDAQHAEALAAVERLLGDESLDFSAYQDYRNYFSYRLLMRDVESGRVTSFDRRRGVASGAERQVPFYVIIGAALSSIYHGARRQYERADLGIGLAVFDEAFSKMDGPNQRSLLEFYDDIGLQVVIAAPTEKRAVVNENLDTVVHVFRHGDVASVDRVLIKPLARARLREANPEHLGREQLDALLVAGTADRAT